MSRPVIIMVAPNGARKTKSDHQGVPVTIDETVQEAKDCFENGAAAIHAHVRDDEQQHVLDADLYLQLIRELEQEVPDMLVQVTSEAVGRYTPAEQVACIRQVKPGMATMALRELIRDESDLDPARDFYWWCRDSGVHLQHVLFDPDELRRLIALQREGVIPPGRSCAIFVLGRYTSNQQSSPEDLEPFLDVGVPDDMDWFVCAFGSREQDCPLAAAQAGGHARVGFENNLLQPDGKPATSTASQVSSLARKLREFDIIPATPAEAREILFSAG